MSNVAQALAAARDTKALRIGRGALQEVAGLFAEQFPGRKAIVVADANTFRVAGAQVVERLNAAGVAQDEAFVFTDPDLYAEYSHVDRLLARLTATTAIPVAVGSGTINDLTKLSAHLSGRPYLCVATAASMDGYTAFGASITARGAKQTFHCPAPQACLADIDIIRQAPPAMTASGYADLFAKITAGADWLLADSLGEEPIDRQAWNIVQDGLHDALSNPDGVKNGDPAALTQLVEGLLLGGFAMQWLQSSRPASGAEHQFSHLWNMEHHLHNGKQTSHGFQVSIGTLAVTALYEQAMQTPMAQLDIAACCRAWPSQEEQDQQVRDMFAGTDFQQTALQETRAKYIDRAELAKQLQRLTDQWPTLRRALLQQLTPLSEARRRLALAGAPVSPEQIGLSPQRLRDTFVRAQCIRRRFTILDLALRTAMLHTWINRIIV
ncbi:MAG: sn-glycerol-1-phosphate dehydrogenase [Prevotellaceae bacterium]|jgi:glycerol-1-phosphate dehydrogenase [NAD(P)+]|nr:sn-glycerol-1-phosphate dehydrogenase [Prevotellaceae bacterium]